MTEKKNKTFVEKIAPFIAIVGLIVTSGYFIYGTFINVPKTNLEFNILANTNLIDIKEDISKLNVIYDSINFIEDQKNISFTIIEVINSGNKSISTNDYDLNIPFGIRLTNATLIKKPVLISSSDPSYFKDIVENNSENQIFLKKKIIDSKESFQLKLYSIHERNLTPQIEFIGKISGQKNIIINDKESIKMDENEIQRIINERELNQLTTILSIALITILSLLTLSLYKNNNIRLKTNNMLHKKNYELISQIEELQNKSNKKKSSN